MLYLPGLGGPFLFDDYSNLPQVQVDSLNPIELKDAALSNTSGQLRRPVANLSLALNGYFFGNTPYSFKVVNLLLHLCCGLAVFFLARSIARLGQSEPGATAPDIIALIAAGIWLLHPIQVSTTLYVVQRMAQLSTLFAFLAAIAWLRWRSNLGQGQWPRTVGWLLVIGSCSLLSLLSKESGALIPLLLLVLEGTLFRFAAGPGARGQWLTVNGILIATPLALGIGYTIAAWDTFVGGYAVRSFDMGDRLLTEIHALWHYLRLIFLPDLGAMGLYYDHFPITRSVDTATAILGIGLAGILISGLWLAVRHPILGVAILWFFAGHALESSFIALEPVFEHRNYLPLLGPALFVAYLAPRAVHRAGEAKGAVIVGMSLVGVLIAGLMLGRVFTWSDRVSFLEAQVARHPTSFRVNLEFINGAMRAQNWQGALERIERIRTENPHESSWPYLRLFVACGTDQAPEQWLGEAREMAATSRVSKSTVMAIQALTSRKVERICPALTIEQIASIVGAALQNDALGNKGKLRSLLLLQKARLFVLSGDATKAAESYYAAWKAQPDSLTALLDLAHLQIALGQYDEADETIDVLQQVVESKPLDIGESWVSDVKARLALERLSSRQTSND